MGEVSLGEYVVDGSLLVNEHSTSWLVQLLHDGRFSSHFKRSFSWSSSTPTKVCHRPRGEHSKERKKSRMMKEKSKFICSLNEDTSAREY